jgi:PleD family two-component response regulator
MFERNALRCGFIRLACSRCFRAQHFIGLGGVAAIIIAGEGDKETAVRALKDGANDYLTKDLSDMHLYLLPIVVKETIIKQRLRQDKDSVEKEREKLFCDFEKVHRELKALSRIDPLTEISNRGDIK